MNIFRNILFLAVLSGAVLTVQAQDIRRIIAENPNMSGGKYASYPLEHEVLTPAPKGYKPFYISHYGRHGSRWHSNMKFYNKTLKFFSDADSCGGLTVLGKDVYERMKRVYEDARDRAGILTPKGVVEHRAIAGRMYRNYPEVFSTRGGDAAASLKPARQYIQGAY